MPLKRKHPDSSSSAKENKTKKQKVFESERFEQAFKNFKQGTDYFFKKQLQKKKSKIDRCKLSFELIESAVELVDKECITLLALDIRDREIKLKKITETISIGEILKPYFESFLPNQPITTKIKALKEAYSNLEDNEFVVPQEFRDEYLVKIKALLNEFGDDSLELTKNQKIERANYTINQGHYIYYKIPSYQKGGTLTSKEDCEQLIEVSNLYKEAMEIFEEIGASKEKLDLAKDSYQWCEKALGDFKHDRVIELTEELEATVKKYIESQKFSSPESKEIRAIYTQALGEYEKAKENFENADTLESQKFDLIWDHIYLLEQLAIYESAKAKATTDKDSFRQAISSYEQMIELSQKFSEKEQSDEDQTLLKAKLNLIDLYINMYQELYQKGNTDFLSKISKIEKKTLLNKINKLFKEDFQDELANIIDEKTKEDLKEIYFRAEAFLNYKLNPISESSFSHTMPEEEISNPAEHSDSDMESSNPAEDSANAMEPFNPVEDSDKEIDSFNSSGNEDEIANANQTDLEAEIIVVHEPSTFQEMPVELERNHSRDSAAFRFFSSPSKEPMALTSTFSISSQLTTEQYKLMSEINDLNELTDSSDSRKSRILFVLANFYHHINYEENVELTQLIFDLYTGAMLIDPEFEIWEEVTNLLGYLITNDLLKNEVKNFVNQVQFINRILVNRMLPTDLPKALRSDSFIDTIQKIINHESEVVISRTFPLLKNLLKELMDAELQLNITTSI